MGWISDRHMRQGGSLNPNPKNNGSDKGPLRKVVRMVDDPQFRGVRLELLECGHTAFPRSDVFGHAPAERRRCRKCKRGAPPDDLVE
jgi:hypothetical protein